MNFIIYLKIKSILSLMSWLSFSSLQKLGLFLSKYIKLKKTTKVITQNINHCFESLSGDKKNKLIKESYSQTFISGAEMISIISKKPDYLLNQISEIHGKDMFLNSIKDNTPMILSGHHGCWEIAAMYFASITEVAMLYTPAKKPYIDKLLYKARSNLCSKMSPANKAGIKTLLKSMKEKCGVGILIDQIPKGSGYYIGSFFNKKAKHMDLPDKIYKKFKPSVFFTYCIRKKDNSLKLCIEDISEDIKNNFDSLEHPVMEICNKKLEEIVLLNPEQYQWSYKKFKGIDNVNDIYI